MRQLGLAQHRYDDGSVGKLAVDLYPKGAPGFAVIVRDATYDLGRDEWVPLAGAAQCRRLAELLNRAADRLERRGEP